LLSSIQTIQHRHRDIDHDHVWLQFERAADQGATVAHRTNNIKFGFEQLPAQICNQNVIIGD
jgi:hypothetical protein